MRELTLRRAWPKGPVALVGTVATASAVATTVVVLGSAEPNAFAGWSASPTTPTAGQVTNAQAVCRARLDQAMGATKGGVPLSFTPMLTDVRGPYAVTVFGDGRGGLALCLTAPNGAVGIRQEVGTSSVVPSNQIRVDQVSLTARNGQVYTLVEGRVGTSVTRVSLGLNDGNRIETTTGNGVFVAWWPGNAGIQSADVVTPMGTTTQAVDLPGVPVHSPPGAPPS
jgi:hypothetical protein